MQRFRMKLFRQYLFQLVTSATHSSNRGERLLVVGHLSGGAGNPTELLPSRGHHSAPLRAGGVFLWLCCGV